jgi:hypothetical protein
MSSVVEIFLIHFLVSIQLNNDGDKTEKIKQTKRIQFT